MSRSRPTIAVLIGAAWPDNDASGPVQSVRQIARALSDRCDFHFFARTGPPGAAALARHGETVRGMAGETTWLDIGRFGAGGLAGRLSDSDFDALWVNSVWDREFTLPALVARRIGRIPDVPVLLSTRGEMSHEALAIHGPRKRMLKALLQATGLLRDVTLHTTGPIETADVRREFPDRPIFEAGNIRALPDLPEHAAVDAGTLKLLFLGRISPVKGLANALRAMAKLDRPAHLDIYGPVHDADYWKVCRGLIDALPDQCSVDWHGPVANEDAARVYAATDLFLNLSASENFGHTIFESLAAGTPVLTGLKTPWNDLEHDRAGFNRASDDPAAIAAAIAHFASLSTAEREAWRTAARQRAERFVADQRDLDRWHDWFAGAAARS